MKNLLLGMLCLAILSCGEADNSKKVDNSQDQTEEADIGGGRTNRAKESFNAQSEIITKATHWRYSESDGEWNSSENTYSYSNQEFISMQFKTLVVDSAIHYALMIERKEGELKDPSDEESFYTWKEMVAYIFTEEEYNKLNTTSDGVIELKTQYKIPPEKIGSYNNKSFISDIKEILEYQKELDEDIGEELREELRVYFKTYTFPVQKITVEGESFVRFYVPENFPKHSNYDFETEYYEVTPAEFNKLLIK